jgi:hypothetical protein
MIECAWKLSDPIRFDATVIYWRGPAPFFFAPIPLSHAERLRQMAKFITYGWGVIPVEATIADVAFRTSLFPKDKTYLLPLKAAVRRKTGITAGDSVFVEMTL